MIAERLPKEPLPEERLPKEPSPKKRQGRPPEKFRRKETRAERNARLRENYYRLRQAGFSPAEAARYRNAPEQKIREVIVQKKLPPIQEAKRGAKKLKITEKEFSTSIMRTIEIPDLSDRTWKNLRNESIKAINEGFTYFSIRIAVFYVDGTVDYKQTIMHEISEIEGIGTKKLTLEQFKDILSQLFVDLADETEFYRETIGQQIKDIRYEIVFWKVKPKRGK